MTHDEWCRCGCTLGRVVLSPRVSRELGCQLVPVQWCKVRVPVLDGNGTGMVPVLVTLN